MENPIHHPNASAGSKLAPIDRQRLPLLRGFEITKTKQKAARRGLWLLRHTQVRKEQNSAGEEGEQEQESERARAGE